MVGWERRGARRIAERVELRGRIIGMEMIYDKMYDCIK